ncbi:UV radiation resistance-associated gene protein-like isoform X2 [Tubulanus polymorphus]|uniref:UV radiation resistance-associated gene protein-like isoform X2 n=1 Tax=Tubulanus polymorphus TaxID=672921 RepID=UPI003DA66F10
MAALNVWTDRQRLLALPTRQRRLRHLKNISARNLVLSGTNITDVSEIISYFTLHLDEKSKEFYRSESIKGSMNPTWRSFDLCHILDGSFVGLTSFVIRVWAGPEKLLKLVLEWSVDLTGLVLLGNQLQLDSIKHKQNSLIFGLFDSWFGCPESEMNLLAEDRQIFPVEANLVRNSYDTNSLSRIMTVLRAVKQTQSSINKTKSSIEDHLLLSQTRSRKLAVQEMSDLRVNNARKELDWQTAKLQQEKALHDQHLSANHQRNIGLRNKHETLVKDEFRLHEKMKHSSQLRQEFIHANTQLFLRQKQLISELALIYPIEEVSENKFTICGVHLPNSEDFQGHDEIRIAVALGYTCHLVLMISQVLDVPLRYSMEHLASRSKIRDHIHDKLADKDRDFPLYSKGKEKFQFNYAVYLLNKNIAQLRNYCGLGTHDLRLTLQNVKSLLELRLGVKFDQYRATVMSLNPSTNNVSPGTSPHNEAADRPRIRGNSSFEEILFQEAGRKKTISEKSSDLPPAAETIPETTTTAPPTPPADGRREIPRPVAIDGDSSRDSSVDHKEREMEEYYETLVRRLTINETTDGITTSHVTNQSNDHDDDFNNCDNLPTNSNGNSFKTWNNGAKMATVAETQQPTTTTLNEFEVSTKLFKCNTDDFRMMEPPSSSSATEQQQQEDDDAEICDRTSLSSIQSDESCHSFDGLLSGLRDDEDNKDIQLRTALLSQKARGSFRLANSSGVTVETSGHNTTDNNSSAS